MGNPLHQLSLEFPLSSHLVLSCCPSTTGLVPVPGPSSHALGPSLLSPPPFPQSPRVLYSDICLMINRCSENVTPSLSSAPPPPRLPSLSHEYSVQGAMHGDSLGK